MPASQPKLTLYHWKISYFSAVARFALSEAGLAYDSKMVTLADHSNTKPEYVALNPKGTVPTLVIDHGDSKEVLTESRDILNWSVERMPSLRGGKSAEEFVERFYSGDLDYMVAAGVAAPEANRKGLLEKWGERVAESRRRYEEATDPELKKLYKEKLELNEAKVADFPSHGPPWGEDKADWMLGELEKILLADGKDPARDWLCGPEFSQADICATVMVDRLAMYGYEGKVWGNGKHEAAATWLSRVRSRPGYLEGIAKWN